MSLFLGSISLTESALPVLSAVQAQVAVHPALPLLRSQVAKGASACSTCSSLRADRGGDALRNGVEKVLGSARHAGSSNRFGSSCLLGIIEVAELHGVGRRTGRSSGSLSMSGSVSESSFESLVVPGNHLSANRNRQHASKERNQQETIRKSSTQRGKLRQSVLEHDNKHRDISTRTTDECLETLRGIHDVVGGTDGVDDEFAEGVLGDVKAVDILSSSTGHPAKPSQQHTRVHQGEGSGEEGKALRKRPGRVQGEKKGSEFSEECAEVAHLAPRLWKGARRASCNEREEDNGDDKPLEDGQDAPKRKENHSNG